MGISIDVGSSNQDYSYLFQSLSGGNLGDLNMLSDYASIKNGSYGKLMKAYYGDTTAPATAASKRKTGTNDVLDQILEAKKYPKVSKEAQAANSKLTSGLSNLTGAVSTLQSEKTYQDSEDGTGAAQKVVSAMKNFVSMYNDVVSAAKDSTLTGKTSHVAGMMKTSQANADKLAQIGVTVNRDGTLELNEEKLKAADISKVQELFSKDDVMSYGSTVMARLGFASYAADPVSSVEKEQESEKQDTATYTGAASLKTDIEKLISDSLFQKIKDEDGTEHYDIEAIFAAAKSFVGNYNSMLDAAGSHFNSGVVSNLARIMEKTEQNKNALEQFGISVDAKGKLKLDGDTFKKADMSQVQKFFNEYASSIATNVSLVNYYMTTQADVSTGYTASGTYNAQDNFRYHYDV